MGELAGGAGRPGKQAEEEGASLGKCSKLSHVANALRKGDGGGAPAKQARKPIGGLKARLVVVECEEDPGATLQGRGDAFDAVGAQGGDRGDAPPSKGKPVEEAFGHHRKTRSGTKTPKSKHRLGAGEGLEPGPGAGIDGATREPADKPAGEFGDDHHPGEPLGTPLGEQAAVPGPVGGEAEGLKCLPQTAARGETEPKPDGGLKADAPRGKVLKPGGAAPELPSVEPRRRRQERRVPGRQRRNPRTP